MGCRVDSYEEGEWGVEAPDMTRLSSLNSCVVEMVRLRCADTKICSILTIKELSHRARLARRGVTFARSPGVMRINPVRYPVVRTAAAVDNPVHMMKVEIINSFNIPYVQDLVG